MDQNDKKEARPPVGIVDILPPLAVSELTEAAAAAREYPIESVERKRIIDKAIQMVKRQFPDYFFED